MTQTLYRKRIQLNLPTEELYIYYYGITTDFQKRQWFYNRNNRDKTTFVQCSLLDTFRKNNILYTEYPLEIIKDKIETNTMAEVEELWCVLEEKRKQEPNVIVFGSFFTFPVWKIQKSCNIIHFLKHIHNSIFTILQSFSLSEITELQNICKTKNKNEVETYLIEKGFFVKDVTDITLGYGGFCYKCEKRGHIQRQCPLL